MACVQLGNLYLDAMDKIYAVSPSTLMLIEGSMTGGVGNTGINWGDGFVSDDTVLRSTGLTDPRPFFNTLLGKPYLNNVALSPHMYPPSITKTFNVSHSSGALLSAEHALEASCGNTVTMHWHVGSHERAM